MTFVEIVYNKILSMKKRKFGLSDIAKEMGNDDLNRIHKVVAIYL